MKDTVATVKRLPPGQITTILGVKYQKSLDGRRLTVYKPLGNEEDYFKKKKKKKKIKKKK